MLERLDDEDFPALTMGQATELLGVQPSFLRSLDAADVLHPYRSTGGHRRYSRRQLALAVRLRELTGDGHPLAAAARIAALETDLAAAEGQRDTAQTERDTALAEGDQAHRDLDELRARLASEQPGHTSNAPADAGRQ
jgi:MerR family transcriptional regulator, heat shock protein HspR